MSPSPFESDIFFYTPKVFSTEKTRHPTIENRVYSGRAYERKALMMKNLKEYGEITHMCEVKCEMECHPLSIRASWKTLLILCNI